MAELFNPETASLEELRSRCEQGEVEPPTPAPVTPAPAAEPPELVTYRRRVENPDGTETVFEADSMSELVDLLVEAQRNSTIQIKKMSAQVPKPSTNSAQEEFQTAYEFQSAPSRTFERLLEKSLGKDSKTIRTTLQKISDRTAEEDAARVAQAWVDSTPNYYPCPENGKRLQSWCRINSGGQPVSLEMLDRSSSTSSMSSMSSMPLFILEPSPQASERALPDVLHARNRKGRSAAVVRRRNHLARRLNRVEQSDPLLIEDQVDLITVRIDCYPCQRHTAVEVSNTCHRQRRHCFLSHRQFSGLYSTCTQPSATSRFLLCS